MSFMLFPFSLFMSPKANDQLDNSGLGGAYTLNAEQSKLIPFATRTLARPSLLLAPAQVSRAMQQMQAAP